MPWIGSLGTFNKAWFFGWGLRGRRKRLVSDTSKSFFETRKVWSSNLAC